MTGLCTRSGRVLSPLAPRLELIAIEDIAAALAWLTRWAGQAGAYSVAQHSVLVSRTCAPDAARWGLLHDGAEAYLGDVPAPVKALPHLAGYRTLEAMWQRTVYHRFGLYGEEPASIQEADLFVRAWERRDLVDGRITRDGLPTHVLTRWTPEVARQSFVDRFQEVT